jgi:ketosteroid isomerase-like protein
MLTLLQTSGVFIFTLSQVTEEHEMAAKGPEEICYLFQRYMAQGDLDSVLSVYDPEAIFLNQTGEVKKGGAALRQELAPFAARKAIFNFNVRQVVQTGDIALMHTDWNVSGSQPRSVYAIEVARRQPDGTWRWLIGDPFTVGRRVAA